VVFEIGWTPISNTLFPENLSLPQQNNWGEQLLWCQCYLNIREAD
jgi:hypothetical protein